ncbi:MAG: ABC transporter permease [Acidobacteriia bacterium]|nr:ABC transporter permease [Terriglobia bacterium]
MRSDILWAFRWLRHNPLFAAAIIAILALGIGANTAIFSIVDAVLLRPLPYAAASRLARIEETSARNTGGRILADDFLAFSRRTDLFEKIAAHTRDDVTLYGAGEPDQVVGRRVTKDLFPILGSQAQLGRPLGEGDHEAVLSDRLWRRKFHADPRVLGSAITISDELYTIVGVMPPNFDFPYGDVEIWLPLRVNPGGMGVQTVTVRLREGISFARAQSALDVLARQWQHDDPQKYPAWRIAITPWRDDIGAKYEQTMMLILAAVGLVLLIACADVSSLMLSRAVQRQREIAVRAALGAGLGRLLRQLLAESLVLAVAGSAAGIGVAQLTLRFLARQLAMMPVVLPHFGRVAINGRVLAVNAAACFMMAAIFSLAPLLVAARTNVQDGLRAGQRSSGPRGASRLFSILIACETAFAFLLLVGSGLMVRSLIRLQEADHGLHTEHVLTMRVPIGSLTQVVPRGRYATKARQMSYYRQLVERLQRIPGVDAVAIVNNLPLSGVNTSLSDKIPGLEGIVPARTISSQYFAVMGIPILAGRAFTDADTLDSPLVVIINEFMARALFPNRDPVGQFVPGSSIKIVGVVKNTPAMSYEAPPRAEQYRPYQQVMFGVFLSTLVVRTARDPMALAATLRKEVWAIDPDQPIVKVEMMDDIIANSIWRPRFSAWLFSVLGGLALALTAVGVYSVVAYTTSLRAREVGIRVALGATPWGVAALIVRGAMLPLAAGLIVSAVGALLVSRLLASILYEVKATDPLTYIGAAVVLLGMGVIASARPAWKVASGDPAAALRAE